MNTGVYKLYPDEENLVVGESTAGKFEGFDVVNTTILMKIKDVMLECDNPEEHRQLDGSCVLLSWLYIRCGVLVQTRPLFKALN